MLIKKEFTILFQGDSITDGGRNREDSGDLGSAYPKFVATIFNSNYSDYGVKFLNRGISGNRVKDLKARWSGDCLDLKPDLVSVLIGINDTWRRYDSNDPCSLVDFKKDYHDILLQVKEKTRAKIVICEPFLLALNDKQETWREDLNPKIRAIRQLAEKFADLYLPLDSLFAQASKKQKKEYWVEDGVHPTLAGHYLIAKSWLKNVLSR